MQLKDYEKLRTALRKLTACGIDMNQIIDVEIGSSEFGVVLRWISNLAFTADTRQKVVCNLFRRKIAPLSEGGEQVHGGKTVFRIPPERWQNVQAILPDLRFRTALHLVAPLTPQAVDKALNITTQERLRWYKDGRLPICGRNKRGTGKHSVHIPQFPIEAIARIAARPALIEVWRQDDQPPVPLDATDTRRKTGYARRASQS